MLAGYTVASASDDSLLQGSSFASLSEDLHGSWGVGECHQPFAVPDGCGSPSSTLSLLFFLAQVRSRRAQDTVALQHNSVLLRIFLSPYRYRYQLSLKRPHSTPPFPFRCGRPSSQVALDGGDWRSYRMPYRGYRLGASNLLGAKPKPCKCWG